jgi:hypothetical protein
MAKKQQFARSHDERAFAQYRQRFAGGAVFPESLVL